MDLKEIKALIDLITKNGLSEFELEKEEFKIRIKKSGMSENSGVYYAPALTAAPQAAPGSAIPAAAVIPPPGNFMEILSPMVGTLYRSPSPDSAAYVEVGQEVNEDTVVCIIEAMKVMNEIKAETRGVVTDILVENGKPVDYNKPLFRLKPL